jgi:hypothetical protein
MEGVLPSGMALHAATGFQHEGVYGNDWSYHEGRRAYSLRWRLAAAACQG